jgi:ABC-type branched-subunit amino acid transport system ATPase component
MLGVVSAYTCTELLQLLIALQIFPTNMRGRGLSGGEKMVLRVSRIHMASRTLLLLFGMAKS